jgi:ankyrin repeat protein
MKIGSLLPLALLLSLLIVGVESFRDRLYDAVYLAEADLVKVLLSTDRNVLTSEYPIWIDRLDENNRTALLVCGFDPQIDSRGDLDKRCTKIAKLLDANGSNMTYIDPYGWNAVTLGAIRGLSTFCEYLIKEKNVPCDLSNEDGRTPLMLAVSHGFFDTAMMLVSYGANITTEDKNGLSMIHYAARLASSSDEFLQPMISFIKQLKKKEMKKSSSNFNIDARDEHGRTPLMYAIMNKSFSAVKALIEHLQADPRLFDSFGVSTSAMVNNDPSLLQLLTDAVAARAEREHVEWLLQQEKENLDAGSSSDARSDGASDNEEVEKKNKKKKKKFVDDEF